MSKDCFYRYFSGRLTFEMFRLPANDHLIVCKAIQTAFCLTPDLGSLAVVFIPLLHSFIIFWPVFAGILGGAAVGPLTSRLQFAASNKPRATELPVDS